MRQRLPSKTFCFNISISRFFHGPPNVLSSLQHPIRQDPPFGQSYSHLARVCLELCTKVGARQVFDELPDWLYRVLKTGKAIHAQGLKLGISSKGLLGNSIVDVYAKCGHLGFARKTFDRLERKDVFAWNSILSMYSKWGLLEEVADSFVLLRSSGVLPNGFTFAMVLSTCARIVDLEFGMQIHCGVVKMGFEFDSYCEGAIVDMYAKCNKMSDARRFFDGAKKMDAVSWTAMVMGYVQVGLPDQAIELFKEMKKVGLVPDQVAYVTALSACVGVGKLDCASELFAEMPSRNVVAWNLMISGHAKACYAVEALGFFVKMRSVDVKPTRSTLGSILSAIASLGALEYGLLVHAHAVKQGLDSNFYVGSSLINMYAKCEKVDASKKVFDSLDYKNIVLWNAMLGGYAQNRYSFEVIELFSRMKAVQPDEFTYTSVLSACSCLDNLELGQQLHSVIIKNKLTSNLFVANALIDMYAKSGALMDARKQFERLNNRDKVSWNAIIVGYVQEDDETNALNMFRRMIFDGTMPDEVSLASILSACANRQALEHGQQVHCLSVKSGLETSLYAGSSLVDMYAKCGNIETARKVFFFMPHWGVVAMNVLIAGYAQINLGEAINLFRYMQAAELWPTDITFASLLDACNGADLLMLGRQIHGAVLKSGLLYGDCDFLRVSLLGMYLNSQRKAEAGILFSEFPKPKGKVLWTSMISGLTQNGCSEEALDLYREMRIDNATPDQATFASVLRACATLSSLTDGRAIHSLVFCTGFDLDELTCSSLVDMYAKCGDVKSSTQVFGEMRTKTDVIAWNSMIVGFAKNGHAEEAIKIFDEMNRTQIMPDDVTFLGILTACSHAGKVSEGRRIFNVMTNEYGIQPRADHLACMVDLLGRWGFLKEAEEFIQSIKLTLDPMIWSALLGSCRLHGDELRGRRAAEKLIDSDPTHSSPYVLLSNIYASSGNWNKVNSLRVEMREKGVAKLPGCSWIAVGQTTHAFVAGDNSHPNFVKIRVVLQHLTGLMKDSDSSADDLEPLSLREAKGCEVQA